MALAPNKTTGKAVADIKALYFLKHENGVEPEILAMLDSDKWFPVLTLRGTVNATQDNPSIDKINVDQFDAPIGITTEPGDFTFEAQLPSLIKDDLKVWLGDGLEEAENKTIDGNQVIGFDLDGTIHEMSVLIKTKTNASIIFSKCQFTLAFSKEDKVFLLKISGQILAPSNEKNKMIYLAAEKAAIVNS